MPLRNGEHGYGLVTKALHWSTVLAVAGQFAVGYRMDADGDVADRECDPAGEDRSGGDTGDAEDERLDQIEEQCEAGQERREEHAEDGVGTAWSDLASGDILADGVTLTELHVLLGILIIALATLRVAWRRATPLPPWDPRLTPTDQRLVHATEVTLLTLLFVVPATGIALVLGADGWLPLHIAAHIGFFAALAVHLAVVIGKRLVPRMT